MKLTKEEAIRNLVSYVEGNIIAGGFETDPEYFMARESIKALKEYLKKQKAKEDLIAAEKYVADKMWRKSCYKTLRSCICGNYGKDDSEAMVEQCGACRMDIRNYFEEHAKILQAVR